MATNTLDFIVKNGIVVNNTATILEDSQSSSTTTGALQVVGGVGIGGNLHVGGEIVAEKLTIQFTTVTTTLIQTDDIIQTLNTTNATSITSGALQIAGGAGIAKDLYIGDSIKVNLDEDFITGGAIVSRAGDNTSAIYGYAQNSSSAKYGVNGDARSTGTNSAGVRGIVDHVSDSALGYLGFYDGNSYYGVYTPDKAKIAGVLSATNATNATSTITGAVIVSGGVGVGGNLHVGGSITSKDNVYLSNSASVSSVSTTTVDTFDKTVYRSSKYIIQVSQSTNYQASEILILHNGTDAFITEYGVVRSNSNLATFSTDINGNNVRLLVNMSSATAATIKMNRISILV